MKKQFRTAMLSTACMLIVAVMSLTGVTYAWFSQGNNATVSGMQMNVATASGGIEVSSTDALTGYKNDLTLNLTQGLVMPVSTADAVHFFGATIDRTDATKISTTAAADSNIIIQKLWLRNTGTEEIKVTFNGSEIVSSANTATNLSKSDLVKAARMAVLNTHDLDALRAEDATPQQIAAALIGGIYAPAGADAPWYGVKAASGTTSFTMYASNETYTTELTSAALTDIEITLPAMNTDGTYNPVAITVIIWLEGQDTHANNLNAGGAFNTSLNIIKKGETPQAPEVGE